MKYVKPVVVASLAVCAVLTSVTGQASAVSGHKAVVGPAATFQCYFDGCSVPGVLNVDPQTVVGPDATDPALRVGRWPRTIYITCVFDATGDGTKYRVYVDDRGWTGEWWVDKKTLQSPAPGMINDRSIPRCPDFF